MHIGILQTGRFPPALEARHGKMEGFFFDLFERAGSDFTYRIYATIDGVVPREKGECEAYLITGSPHGVYEDLPWIASMSAFIRRAADDGEKLLGICFGHQAIAHALGGSVEKSAKGWGIGVHDYQVTAPAAWMDRDIERFTLLVSHQDQVVTAPAGARIHASSDFCPNAMMSLGENIFSLQGHPEHVRRFTADLIEMRRDLLGPELAARAAASLDRATDELVVANWITRFFAC